MTLSKSTSPEERLKSLRELIDQTDREVLTLLNKRAEVVLEVGRLKKEDSQAGKFYVPHRERDIFESLVAANEGKFPTSAIPAVYREIISACRSLETPLNIGYLGPPSSYCHAAALQKFGTSATFFPYDGFSAIFRAVEKGECHYGVVAFRNSTQGVITETLDNFQRSELNIYAEAYLDIHHQFLSKSPPEEIKRIYTHGQAFAQCQEWLEKHFPNVEYTEVSSTSHGAERAAREEGAAAIASDLAAQMYDVPILFPNIEDRSHNTTRFVIIGYDFEAPTGRDKTSMIIHVRNQPGALFDALEPFRKSGINLTHIDSRPTKQERWEYLFFIEFEGHREESRVKCALAELESHCLHVKLLGSYADEDQKKEMELAPKEVG
ncbi:MAG: prephenate dehydratase [Candidatus Omnitrophica bacterium]|nr:prephenate dehydratase [Candidatus Omnitrophota bacterium]